MSRIHPNISSEQDKRAEFSRESERLQYRIELLEDPERTLMEMQHSQGVRLGQLSRLTGIPVSTLGRRLKSLTARLLDEAYITFRRHQSQFSRVELQVAYDHFLLRLGYRRIGVKRRIGAYAARNMVRRLEVRLHGLKVKNKELTTNSTNSEDTNRHEKK